jgi:HK97 family phage portal protein
VRHTTQNGHGAPATAEREPFVLIPLDEKITPILEAGRTTRTARADRARNGMRSISQAWDDTEALGITADMRRSGPGMLSDQDRKDTLYKAYLNSVWISACVDVISKRITSGGYTIEYCGPNEQPTSEEEAQKKQLQAFIEYTNDDEDFLQLVRAIVADILVYGECFVEVVRQNGVPHSLHKIDCITMNYQLDRHGNIVKYIQNMYHSTETIEFAPEDIIRFWLPSPFASKVALSPIERIMGSIDADVHMADWVRSFFRKGARPNFWIKFPGPKEEADRFVAWLRENYTGMANAHVPLVLYDEAELYEIGKGSVDVDFLKGRELMCKEILAGYQVPPALVGLIESGNIGGGTGESQEKSFLRNACDPLRAIVMGQINYRITQQGFNCTCWKIGTRYADYRDDTVVSEIQDRRIRNGSMSINEVRRDMNRPPVDGGDINIVVTSRDVQPLDRLPQLSDEQAAQAAAATAHVQAQAALAQAQADKLKEPPPEPTSPLAAPAALPSPEEQEQAQERVILRRQLSALLERLEQHERTERARQDAVQLLNEALAQSSRGPEELPSRIGESLATIEEHLRALRAQNVTPRKLTERIEQDQTQALPQEQETLSGLLERARTQIANGECEEGGFSIDLAETEAAVMISQRGTCDCPICQDRHGQPIADGQVPPYHDGCDCVAVSRNEEQLETQEDTQVHTGMMIAFLLDADTAKPLALPDGEPASDLHITLAYLGDGGDTTLPRNSAQDSGDLTDLQHILASVVAQEQPLQGSIGGLGRFAASEDSEWKDPVIALVDVPGLAELRVRIVSVLQMNGYFVANNHGYTPHVTLAYIDPDAPLPVETVPALPLQFKEVCLAIGDARYFFPMGGESHVTRPHEDTEAVPPDAGGSEHEAARISAGDLGTAASDPAGDPEDRGEQGTGGEDEPVAGPGDLSEQAKKQMTRGQLKQELHDLFTHVADRGRKAIGEEEEKKPDAE